MLELLNVENLLINKLPELWDLKKFNKEFDIFYKGQIPTSAIFIEAGEVAIIKRNKIANFLTVQKIIFLEELLLEKELKHTIRVFPNTQLYLIDRYSILENFATHA